MSEAAAVVARLRFKEVLMLGACLTCTEATEATKAVAALKQLVVKYQCDYDTVVMREGRILDELAAQRAALVVAHEASVRLNKELDAARARIKDLEGPQPPPSDAKYIGPDGRPFLETD